MLAEPRIVAGVLVEHRCGEEPALGEARVERGAGVALAQDDAVAIRIARDRG